MLDWLEKCAKAAGLAALSRDGGSVRQSGSAEQLVSRCRAWWIRVSLMRLILDEHNYTHHNPLSNGEFQMTTTSSNNLYTSNSNLYIVPTLTSNEIGYDKVINGGNYTLKGCTTNNKTACSASSSSQRSTVINPVQSGRINTKGKKNIAFGKVEVRAKLPQG